MQEIKAVLSASGPPAKPTYASCSRSPTSPTSPTAVSTEVNEFDVAREKKKANDQNFKAWKTRKASSVAAERAKQKEKERQYRQEVAKIQATRTDTAFEEWVERKKRDAQKTADGSKTRKRSSFSGKLTTDEFVAALRRNQVDPPQLTSLFEDLLDRLDHDGKGRVNRSEFGDLFEQVSAHCKPSCVLCLYTSAARGEQSQ
jgi:hypothetical protein